MRVSSFSVCQGLLQPPLALKEVFLLPVPSFGCCEVTGRRTAMLNEVMAIQHLLSTIYSQKIATGNCYISGIDYCCKRNHKAPLWINAKTNCNGFVGNILACDICDTNTDIVVAFFFREEVTISLDSAQKNVSQSGWPTPTSGYPAGFAFANYPVSVRLTKTYPNVSLRDIATIVSDIQSVFGQFGV